jgi:uncharacterized membrane protein YfcA
MSGPDLLGLGALVFVAAILYSMVGHAGASGYLAAMALYGVAPAVMKPTALTLNILVATVGTIQFARAGHFRWRLFWPFALGSVPLAFLGGSLALPLVVYKRVLGVVLLYAAWRLFRAPPAEDPDAVRPVARPIATASGAGIGFLSGLTGVGGGIFLSPLMLLMRWATVRTTAAISVTFILVNSIAGLLGHVSSVRELPASTVVLAGVALAGGLIGSTIGSRRLPPIVLRRALALVLLIAAAKLLTT